MKLIYGIMLPVAVCLHMASCSGHDHEHHSAEEAQQHEQEKEAPGHDDDHGDEIVLKPETAARFGVATDTVRLSDGSQSIKVAGVISTEAGNSAVVAAPVSGTVNFYRCISEGKTINAGAGIASISTKGVSGGDSNMAAKARLEAAKRELDRVTPLHAEGIVSTRDYNAARSAYEEAKAGYSAAASSGAAVSPISGAITAVLVANGQYVNAGDAIATVSSNKGMILRADLPEKYYSLLPDIYDANVKLAYTDRLLSMKELNGRRVTSSTSAAAGRPGYIPVVFAFDNTDNVAIAGAAAEVYLKVRGNGPEQVISIPASALSEQQGNYFVYVKVDDHGYQKTLVKTAGTDGGNVIVTEGLVPGQEIVVKGTSIVRMAETSGVVPEGHHHHH